MSFIYGISDFRKTLHYGLIVATIFSSLIVVGQSDSTSDLWGENLKPKLYTNYLSQYSDSVFRFIGNQTRKDYFKLLQKDGNNLLIGARNIVYNVSLPELIENEDQRIVWNSLDRDVELCLVKGKSKDECQNYIRVLAPLGNGRLLVCGTNAYKPRCRHYFRTSQMEEFKVLKDFSGTGLCPYDPKHNSTALFSGGSLYSGTVADFSGSDSLILKNEIRTGQYDLKQLNDPDFVSSSEDDNYIYFFFRETAVEYINCGKSIFSRVARVCKKDKGGPLKFRNRWTSFIKSRLNCSVPGIQPFYFNEIQSVSNDGEKEVFYGVFTTPDNAIAGSAICRFRMSDISDSFKGPFKDQESPDSNWLPIPRSKVPKEIGTCSNDSLTLPDSALNFIKHHSLMDKAVKSENGRPVFVKTSLGERLTVIAVDFAVKSLYDETYDVVFVGTTKGRVLKIVESELIETIQIFPFHIPVKNLIISKRTSKLVILSDHEVNSIPLERCSDVGTCSECIMLKDPYCAWDLKSSSCVSTLQRGSESSISLLQDTKTGKHLGCPISSTIGPVYDIEEVPNLDERPRHSIDYIDSRFQAATSLPIYSERTLVLSTILTAITASVLGFIVGFLLSRRCDQSLKFEFLERRFKTHPAHKKAPTGTDEASNLNTAAMINSNIVANNKSINLLVNVPPKSETVKSQTAIQNNNKTLQKVKRIYL